MATIQPDGIGCELLSGEAAQMREGLMLSRRYSIPTLEGTASSAALPSTFDLVSGAVEHSLQPPLLEGRGISRKGVMDYFGFSRQGVAGAGG